MLFAASQGLIWPLGGSLGWSGTLLEPQTRESWGASSEDAGSVVPLSGPPTASPGGGWGEQGSCWRSQALCPQWPGEAAQAPGVLSPDHQAGDGLAGVACARRSAGLADGTWDWTWDSLVSSQVLCANVAPQVAVAACPPDLGGDPQKAIEQVRQHRFLKSSPILSWALMQKALGAAGPPAARRWAGGPWPRPLPSGGCAHSRLGPCKRSGPICDSRGVSALSCSSEAHAVPWSHGQRWEGQERARPAVAAAPGRHSAAPGLRGQPHPWSLTARPLWPRTWR